MTSKTHSKEKQPFIGLIVVMEMLLFYLSGCMPNDVHETDVLIPCDAPDSLNDCAPDFTEIPATYL